MKKITQEKSAFFLVSPFKMSKTAREGGFAMS
jgi:hypothetical protein